ncbi:GIY-YIG nuclease family protein [Candidatus Microgenomates bacterium]|nr:GIY-YIG nuclease family protein [Candidatus Microgenomates bacterium]
MITVYILVSLINGKYYIGCTDNFGNRIKKHNSGQVFWTKRYKPWALIYSEEYKTLSDGRIREKQLKSWHKRKEIENLIVRCTI